MFRSGSVALLLVALVASFVLPEPASGQNPSLTFTRQSNPPAAPTISAVHLGDEALTVVWEAPSGVTDITAYDLRYIRTRADETVDSNWRVEEDVWAGGERGTTCSSNWSTARATTCRCAP